MLGKASCSEAAPSLEVARDEGKLNIVAQQCRRDGASASAVDSNAGSCGVVESDV